MSKETELSDEQISDALSATQPEWWDVPRDATNKFARAIIEADRALRRGGEHLRANALSDLVAACLKAKAILAEGVADGEPVHLASAALTYAMSTALMAQGVMPQSDQQSDAQAALAVMTEKGAKAWADVPDATAWVDDLRGNAPSPAAVEPDKRPENCGSGFCSCIECLYPPAQQGGEPCP